MTTAVRPSAPVLPAGRRPQLARLCRRTGVLPAISWLRTHLRQDLRILAYHRILESVEPDTFSFDLNLISASAEAFRAQLAILNRRFTPMRFDELIDIVEHGRPLPPRAVLITFDDGYDDNYRIAYPLLKDAGLSAMFFVSTGHIDSGRPYVYDWLVHMICVTDHSRISMPELGIDRALPASLQARRDVADVLLDQIKALDAATQVHVIARLEREWQLPASAGHPDCRPMRWSELREMQRGGMEIGSHGVDHQMLAKLSSSAMQIEIEQSRATIQRELGITADVLSYPVGGHDAYDAAVISAAQAAGYRMACSYVAGAESASTTSRYEMRRLPVERQMDCAWFEGMLALPELFTYRTRYRSG